MNEWLWIALYGGFFFLMMRFGCGGHMMGHGHSKGEADAHHEGSHETEERVEERTVNTHVHSGKFIDPVCGMPVPRDAGYGKMYEARPYRFCSRACLDKFDADPESYVPAHVKQTA